MGQLFYESLEHITVPLNLVFHTLMVNNFYLNMMKQLDLSKDGLESETDSSQKIC